MFVEGGTKKNRIVQLLRDGADVMDKRGHAKFYFQTEDGFCIQGAMYQVLGLMVEERGTCPSRGYPRHVLHEHYGLITDACMAVSNEIGGSHWGDAVEWNNSETSTKEEIVATMRKAADKLELVNA